MYHIFSTISSKYQGETMFCFVCVATVFGYILGVNRVIDAIISKHSDETRVKVVKMMNKYTQTNLNEIAELLASNNIILFHNQCNISSIDDGVNLELNDSPNEMNTILNSSHDEIARADTEIDHQDKKEDQEKQIQIQEENTVMSPLIVAATASPVSTSEEDYELVRKNENVNHSKHKKSSNYFEWLNIF
jgi:hypothetical protein